MGLKSEIYSKKPNSNLQIIEEIKKSISISLG